MKEDFHDPSLPWAEYARGEVIALEAVYRAHVDEVARLVRRGFTYARDKVVHVPGLGDEAAQMDLIQDSFVRAFGEKARRAYDPQRPYRAYLLRITKNLMIDRLRKSGREVELPDSDGVGDLEGILADDLPFEQEDPACQAHWGRQWEQTIHRVQSLPDEQRTFYRLRYEQAEAQARVAQKMGITRRRVRTLEQGLRRGLRKHLRNKGLWP